MTNIIVAAILLMPWIFIPDVSIIDQMRFPKMVFFDLICMAIIASAFFHGLRFSYKNKYFGILFLIVIFQFLMNWYLPLMMTFEGKRLINLWNVISSTNVILAFVASYCAMSNLDRNGYIKIAKAICLSAFLVSCFGILQAVGFDPMVNITAYKGYEPNHVAAILDHPNMLGNFLALSIPFFLLFRTPIYALGASVCLVCLYLTHSSTSIMAFFISSLFFMLIKNIKNLKALAWIVLAGVLIVGVVANVPSFNKIASGLTGRTNTWKFAIEKVKDNPIFGQGLGKFATYGYKSGGMRWEFVHNDYIELLVSVGFLGLAMFFVMGFNTFKNFNLSSENTAGFAYITSMVAFLVIMFGSFPMEFAPSSLLGMIAFWGAERL